MFHFLKNLPKNNSSIKAQINKVKEIFNTE